MLKGKVLVCKICGKSFYANRLRLKQSKNYCSNKCHGIDVTVKKPDQKNGASNRFRFPANYNEKQKRQAYWRFKYHSDPIFKMMHRQRVRIWKVFHYNQVKKQSRTLKLLGCSAFQLKQYLESKFKEGMTWENHGYLGWHVDHIKPLASFDFNDQKQIEQAFHYTNLQPLWAIENLQKHTRSTV